VQIVDHEDGVAMGAVQERDHLRGFADRGKVAERLAEREVRDVLEHLDTSARGEPFSGCEPQGPHERGLADTRLAADET
jgi:hypothetical protein